MAGVTYRGLHARTSLVRWGLPAVAVGIVVGATAPGAVSGLASVLEANGGGLPWLFERLFAFLAYLAMSGSVVYGLLLSTKILDAIAHRPVNFSLHKDLALVGIGLAAVHASLLALDSSVPFSLAQILVPGMSPHAPLGVAAGQVAFYLLAIVTASFYLRRRIGQRAWRALHYVTFLAFLGATAHGVAAGSDASAPWVQAMYLGSAAVVTFLTVYRIGMSVAQRAASTSASKAPARPVQAMRVAPARQAPSRQAPSRQADAA